MLLLWWLAAHYHWGPYQDKVTSPKTSAVRHGGGSDTSGRSSRSSKSSNSPGAGSAIFNLYGTLHTDQTASDVQAAAGGLKPNCLNVNSAPGSKQKVCTYTQGNRVVTVTYLNDHVVSVSKSGF